MLYRIKNITDIKTTASGILIAVNLVVYGTLKLFEVENIEAYSFIITGVLFGIFAKYTKDADKKDEKIHNQENPALQKYSRN